MVAVPLGPPLDFVVVASPAYLAAHGCPAHPRDLQKHACIRIRFPSGAFYRWEFARGAEQLEVEVDGPLATGDMRAILHAAEDGLGVAYTYARYAAPALAEGRLEKVLEDWTPPAAGLFLYYPSRKLMPAGLRAFVEMLRDETGNA
jgi:DNA-binding transcriptional LysR family regulator